MPFRFPKSVRLTRASEFKRIKEKGESFHGRFIVLSVLKHPESSAQPSQASMTRVGLITSRRVGPAVTRNRVRRRLRELARLSRPFLRDDIWLVIIARARAANASFQALQQDWHNLARRAGILKEAFAQ